MAESSISIPRAQLKNLLAIAVPDDRLTITEAANYLKISDVSLWRIRKDGKIKSILVGRRPFFLKSELDRYLSNQEKEVVHG